VGKKKTSNFCPQKKRLFTPAWTLTRSLNIWRSPTSKWIYIYILGLITGGYMSVILELPNTSHYTIFRSATEKTTHPTLLTHSTQAKRLLTQKCGVFIKATRSSSACLMVNLSVINQPADFSVQMDGIHRSLAKSGLPGSLRLLKLEKHAVYLSLSIPVQIEKLWMYPILWRWWSQGAPFFTLGGKKLLTWEAPIPT
jgi:hypothetical protein